MALGTNLGQIADKIDICNLEVFAYHGVLPEEKEQGQQFIVSMSLFLDTFPAGNADDLSKTINYAEVCEDANSFITSTQFDLIETIAEKLAEFLLMKHNRLDGITIIIKKPNAPIDLPFDDVSVEITRQWHNVYLSVGSNMGDKDANISFALEKLGEDTRFRAIEVSDTIITEPYGPVAQEDFLNACISAQTILKPKHLLSELKKIEKEAGRTPSVRWGPRTLDIDILLYDDLILNEKELTIPHKDMHNRFFVLNPLFEIAPDNLLHPRLNKTIQELLTELETGTESKDE